MVYGLHLLLNPVKVADLMSTRNLTTPSRTRSSRTRVTINSARLRSLTPSLYSSRSLGMLMRPAVLVDPLTQPQPHSLLMIHSLSMEAVEDPLVTLSSRFHPLGVCSGLCLLEASVSSPLERGLRMASGRQRASRLRPSMESRTQSTRGVIGRAMSM